MDLTNSAHTAVEQVRSTGKSDIIDKIRNSSHRLWVIQRQEPRHLVVNDSRLIILCFNLGVAVILLFNMNAEPIYVDTPNTGFLARGGALPVNFSAFAHLNDDQLGLFRLSAMLPYGPGIVRKSCANRA